MNRSAPLLRSILGRRSTSHNVSFISQRAAIRYTAAITVAVQHNKAFHNVCRSRLGFNQLPKYAQSKSSFVTRSSHMSAILNFEIFTLGLDIQLQSYEHFTNTENNIK